MSESVIGKLQMAKEQADRQKVRMRLRGREDDAQKFADRGNRLGDLIERLLNREMEAWTERSDQLARELEGELARLRQSIEEIEKVKAGSEAIVSALGSLDEIIRFGRRAIS